MQRQRGALLRELSGNDRNYHLIRHSPQLRQARAAVGAALALLLQRGQIKAAGEVGTNFVLRHIETVADDAAARRAGGGWRGKRGE